MKWYGDVDLQQTARIKNVPDPQDSRDAISRYHINNLDFVPVGEWDFTEATVIIPVPTSTPAGSEGKIIYRNSQLYIYDNGRGKWLTPSKLVGFGLAGNADGEYLKGPGDAAGKNRGWYMPKDGTIISVSAKARAGNLSKGIIVRINNSNVKSFSLNSGTYISTNDNIDFNSGDWLQVYVRSAGAAVKDLTVTLEIAWRLS